MTRGDVVIVAFPYVQGGQGKVRPALVVQNDRDNRRLTQTVVAMITGNTRHAHEPTQLLVDPSTPDGQSTGLHGPSAVKCSNLLTVAQQDIVRVIGRLSPAMMDKISLCLKSALQID
jgi:mRNA interferase MazF